MNLLKRMMVRKILKKAYWMWYPGDWEIWLHEKSTVDREVRGVNFPPYWKLDTHFTSVIYKLDYFLEEAEEVFIRADGEFSVYFNDDDNHRYNDSKVIFPAGQHTVKVTVYNKVNVPSLYVEGKTITSQSDWKVSCYDSNWKTPGHWVETFGTADTPPSEYALETKEIKAEKIQPYETGWLVDFGKNLMGYLHLSLAMGLGKVNIFYGESKEEAIETDHSTLTDELLVDDTTTDYRLNRVRAFRYVRIIPENVDISLERVAVDYEYLPVEHKATFKSSDVTLNKIWDTSMYTFHLNTREFFIDGIKRDRWVWAGDAYQSFLMNYYSFFDVEVAKRTLIALRGKDPVTSHINTILDYSLYWFISLYDYYYHTGDLEFIENNFESMVSLMDFCLKRENENGFLEGIDEDWVFVDWADIDNTGEVSTIQILFYQSLKSMSLLSKLVRDYTKAELYKEKSEELKSKIKKYFWDDEHNYFYHHRIDNVLQSSVTKYPNLFSILYGLLSKEETLQLDDSVFNNRSIQDIHTPFMRFFELSALGEIGKNEQVLEEILSYWGGMLNLGATTFWERYDANAKDNEHYEMYGMKYGKSLCHAWGASPIYLLGKYFLGVKPTSPGYKSFIVEPKLGGLEWIEGTVPVGEDGTVTIYKNKDIIRVKTNRENGKIRYEVDGEVYEEPIPVTDEFFEIHL